MCDTRCVISVREKVKSKLEKQRKSEGSGIKQDKAAGDFYCDRNLLYKMIPSAISSLLVGRGNLFPTHLDRCGAAGIRDSDSFQQSLDQECGVCM